MRRVFVRPHIGRYARMDFFPKSGYEKPWCTDASKAACQNARNLRRHARAYSVDARPDKETLADTLRGVRLDGPAGSLRRFRFGPSAVPVLERGTVSWRPPDARSCNCRRGPEAAGRPL